ncbi:MAG: rod shape-determining protein MreC [Deltaproteobacteria bacterium]|jgi:rod shape-determining protein MreC|nr:rod shape-determining protein MreC [Syntrophaceae bacterium]
MFFKNYRTVIFIGAMLVGALILLSYNLKYDSGTSIVKTLVLEAAAPVQKLLNAAIGSVEGAWMRYIHLVGLEEDNRKLKQRIGALEAQLILYREGYLEASRLKGLLSLRNDYPHTFQAARVIGKEQAALSKTLWINKGSADGLKPGMPVLAPPGLIGRLTDVSWHSAKVLLLIDENSNVDVLVQRSRVQGIARGAGSRGCVVKYISKMQDVKAGDVVVTSGLSNIFPKGLLVGRISVVDSMGGGLFLQIRLVPYADFASLEEVMVLTGALPDVPEGGKKEK